MLLMMHKIGISVYRGAMRVGLRALMPPWYRNGIVPAIRLTFIKDERFAEDRKKYEAFHARLEEMYNEPIPEAR